MAREKPTNWCWCGLKHAEGYLDAQGRWHDAARELCVYPGCANVRKKGLYCFKHAAKNAVSITAKMPGQAMIGSKLAEFKAKLGHRLKIAIRLARSRHI